MSSSTSILSVDKVLLRADPQTKKAAIELAGRLLVAAGHIHSDYVAAMLQRENVASTYLGNGVAVPHGTREAIASVRSSGMSVLRIPHGVDFGGGNTARLVIGLAARGEDHLEILSNLADICSDDSRLAELMGASSPEAVIAILQGGKPT